MSTVISPRHAAAREYAALGIPIFAVQVNGKKPLAGSHGFKEPTTNLLVIDKLWEEADYNIAVNLEQIGQGVVDVDTKHEKNGLENWKQLKDKHSIPETYTVRTPSGGFHFYFKGALPPTVGREGHALGEGIDTRGLRSYVLLPPSIIDGKEYQVVDDRDLADLPDAIKSLVETQSPRVGSSIQSTNIDNPSNIDRARRYLLDTVRRTDVSIRHGGRNHRAYQLACEVQNLGISPELCFALLEEIWNPHCEPPLDDAELRGCCEHASQYSQNEAGAWGVTSASEAFGQSPSVLSILTEPVPRSRFYPEDEDEQDTGKEPQWLIPTLLPRAATVLVYGPTQSYKSFLTLELALSLSTSKRENELSGSQGLNFYAALEGKHAIKTSRRRAWKIGHGIDKVPNFYVLTAPMVSQDAEVQEFGEEIRKRASGRPIDLIVIDTLAKSMAGLNENNAGDAGRFIRFCDSLVEAFNCTVIAIHHTGKDEEKGARGSTAFMGGFDTRIRVKAYRDHKAVELWVEKHKDAEEPEEPFTYAGKKIGNSLVFFPTTKVEHKKLTTEDSPYTGRKIGAALAKVQAYGEPGITTFALANQLLSGVEYPTMEVRQEAIEHATKVLDRLAKNSLEAYCSSGKWFLPAKEN